MGGSSISSCTEACQVRRRAVTGAPGRRAAQRSGRDAGSPGAVARPAEVEPRRLRSVGLSLPRRLPQARESSPEADLARGDLTLEPRRNRTTIRTLTLGPRRIEWPGFTPSVSLVHEGRVSTVPALFDYRRSRAEVAFRGPSEPGLSYPRRASWSAVDIGEGQAAGGCGRSPGGDPTVLQRRASCLQAKRSGHLRDDGCETAHERETVAAPCLREDVHRPVEVAARQRREGAPEVDRRGLGEAQVEVAARQRREGARPGASSMVAGCRGSAIPTGWRRGRSTTRGEPPVMRKAPARRPVVASCARSTGRRRGTR